MRDTDYAKELAYADLGGKRIKRTLRQAIRLSAWRGNQLCSRPLVVSEDELLILMGDAIAARVFSAAFVKELSSVLRGVPSGTSRRADG